ncbi:hypothetical protein SeMB42_g05126, partial [Synchytrium endobioticum]
AASKDVTANAHPVHIPVVTVGESKKRKHPEDDAPSQKKDGKNSGSTKKKTLVGTDKKERDSFHKKVPPPKSSNLPQNNGPCRIAPPSSSSSKLKEKSRDNDVIIVLDDDDDMMQPMKPEKPDMTSRIVKGGMSMSSGPHVKAAVVSSTAGAPTNPSVAAISMTDAPAFTTAMTVSSRTPTQYSSQSSRSSSGSSSNIVPQQQPTRKSGRPPSNSRPRNESSSSTASCHKPTAPTNAKEPSAGGTRASGRLAKVCESCHNTGELTIRQGSNARSIYCSACAGRFDKRRMRCTQCNYVPDDVEATRSRCIKCLGGTWLYVPP